MHAEYVAVGKSLREVIPIKGMLKEISKEFGISREDIAKVVQVWEDNEGALRLSNSPVGKITPQSKHFELSITGLGNSE